jgi:hypothetical protein
MQPATFPLGYLLYKGGEEVACLSRRSVTVRSMTNADFIACDFAFFFRFRLYLISLSKYYSYT